MRAGSEFFWKSLIDGLNEDIEREWRMAGEHIARAMAATGPRKDVIRRDSCALAAAGMRHATALAAEVLHLGGTPPSQVSGSIPGSRDRLARASDLFRRYRQRLREANDLGLDRLEEVLSEIIQDLGVCSRPRGGKFRLIRIS